ncbi:MAG: glycosyltransferase family 1 protein [Hyphomicrobiaceae bacterium]|nr:glycosyltransferase family 1 protein [Hyphomicrobiaceae bacterium]MCC0010297.1 glycosyltransferase family 1 protein [Hyphomicrobiaceae bacterium]
MRLLIATDAWRPQVNGVVTTLSRMGEELPRLGVDVSFLTPETFRHVRCPGYREIELAIPSRGQIKQRIETEDPDWIHIATEGPIGWAVRRHCLKTKRDFTTSYHTKFPEYASKIFGLPANWMYHVERYFHKPSSGVMVATVSLADELRKCGLKRLVKWSRGVDADRFRPNKVVRLGREPVFLYVGRLSVEKNIDAFLSAALPGRKVVVGDGPYRGKLEQRYRDVYFAGAKFGDELVDYYASADVFVFPSRTETFGVVLLEAMASGLPVAAYPVTGPLDIVEHGRSGVLGEDLAKAAIAALKLDPRHARERAEQFTWAHSASQFLHNIRIAKARSAARRQRSTGTRAAKSADGAFIALDTQGRKT